MRARLAILSSGLTVELREVLLFNKPHALLQASPKGTVPVLLIPGSHPGGQVLEQSLDIMLWALQTHDPQRWLPGSAEGLEDALEWIARCDGDFKTALDRYKYPSRYAQAGGPTDGLAHRIAGAQFLQSLNARLESGGHLGASGWGLADAAIAPFVRQFAHTDTLWFASQPWAALHSWLAAFEASDSFARVMLKQPGWEPSMALAYFPAA